MAKRAAPNLSRLNHPLGPTVAHNQTGSMPGNPAAAIGAKNSASNIQVGALKILAKAASLAGQVSKVNPPPPAGYPGVD